MTQTFQTSLHGEAGAPANSAFVITPSDTVDFDFFVRGIYVGALGDITVVFDDGAVVLFNDVPQGTILPVKAKRVNATGTTSLDLVGLV